MQLCSRPISPCTPHPNPLQHYAYYGCYPSEGLFSASPQAAVPATEAAPPAADAADAAPAASATLPPPPPSPPAPPPMLSAAAWACQPPEGAELQPADSAGTAGAAAAGSGAESGWVSVPGALLARYQQLEWQNWHRQYSEWKSMWEQYKQVGRAGQGRWGAMDAVPDSMWCCTCLVLPFGRGHRLTLLTHMPQGSLSHCSTGTPYTASSSS